MPVALFWLLLFGFGARVGTVPSLPNSGAAGSFGVLGATTVTNTFKVADLRDLFIRALTTKEPGPKVIVAQSECQLNRRISNHGAYAA